MKVRLVAAVLAAMSILSGCDTPGDPNVARTTGGAVLGTAATRDIPEADSLISVTGHNPVTRRVRRELNDRYTEVLNYSGGTLVYEKVYAGGFNASGTGAMEAVTRDTFFSTNGINLSFSSTRTAVNPTGLLTYVVQESGGYRCFIFQQFFGRSEPLMGGIGYREYIRGGQCLLVGHAQAATMESQMLDFLGRLRFDEGRLNKAKAMTQQPAPTPVAASPRPSGNFGSYPLKVTWDGVRDATGTLRLSGQNNGTISLTLIGETACNGVWTTGAPDSTGAVVGSWSVTCAGGRSASGTFRSLRYGQGTGEGRDNAGAAIKIAFGES